jgi:hypothetical protein
LLGVVDESSGKAALNQEMTGYCGESIKDCGRIASDKYLNAIRIYASPM